MNIVLMVLVICLFVLALFLYLYIAVEYKFSCKVRHKHPEGFLYPKGFKGYCMYVLDQDWYHEAESLKMYLYLVSIVNVADSYIEGVVVKKGECFVDIEDLFGEIGMVKYTAKTALFDLAQKGAIEHVKFIGENQVVVKLPDFLEEKGGEV